MLKFSILIDYSIFNPASPSIDDNLQLNLHNRNWKIFLSLLLFVSLKKWNFLFRLQCIQCNEIQNIKFFCIQLNWNAQLAYRIEWGKKLKNCFQTYNKIENDAMWCNNGGNKLN